MEFCDECGSMMKKIDGTWLCPNCSPKEVTATSPTLKAAVLTCPKCKKQRPYCGIEGKLSPVKWKQGIEYHLKHHELDDGRRREYYDKALSEKEIKQVPETVCDEADGRGWDDYNI